MDKSSKSAKKSNVNKQIEKKQVKEAKNQLNTSIIDKKLDNFINRVQDENVRDNYFKKLDDHVNNLLDTVKIKEKKRKSKYSLVNSIAYL